MPLNWSLPAVPLLIALNAFFVAGEYAVVALRPAQLESLRRRGKTRTAAAIEKLKANPASAIGTIQVCITMTNLLLGWIGEPAMSAVLHKALGPAIQIAPAVMTAVATGLSFLIVTLLTVVLSELLPKALTLRYAEAAASLTAVPVLGIQKAVRPLVWLMNAMANAVTRPLGLGTVDEMEDQRVTAEELRLMATQAGDDGVVTTRERSMILNTLTLGRRAAKQIMVPRVRVQYLDLQWSMRKNREVLNHYLHSRLPVCDGGLDRVTGVLHTKEFLSAYSAEGEALHDAGDSRVLSLLAKPPAFVPENVSLDGLLGAFHEHKSQLVFLVDEYGGVEGIVTLQDVVDEIVGEIREGPEQAAGSGADGAPVAHAAGAAGTPAAVAARAGPAAAGPAVMPPQQNRDR